MKKTCAVCGVEFEGTKNRRYCSHPCAKEANRRKGAERWEREKKGEHLPGLSRRKKLAAAAKVEKRVSLMEEYMEAGKTARMAV